MRKRRVWGVAATLALALAAPAARADGGILARMFGPTKPETVHSGPADDDARQEAITARVRVERQKADAEKVRADYLRRLQVVDRLVEIALETNDPVLEKQARELEERATAVYMKRAPNRDTAPPGVEPREDRPTKTRSAPRREEP